MSFNSSRHIHYHDDGHPDDGWAYVKRAWPPDWQHMPVDLMVRYRAEYTIDAERVQHLQDLAEERKPFIQHEVGESWFACDFYFDCDYYVDNNYDHYVGLERWQKLGQVRVFIHVQEYAFADTDGIGEAPCIAIEYWHYYVDDYGLGAHRHDVELHLVVLLNQYDTSQVLLLKFGRHYGLYSVGWGDAEKEDSTHTIVYLEEGKHGAHERPPGAGYGSEDSKIHWDDSRYQKIHVWDTDACKDEITKDGIVYCHITNWYGAHVWWDEFSKDYWPRWYGTYPWILSAMWHKPSWPNPGGTEM